MSTSILVVDDDETIRSLLTLVFEQQGWKVTTAENGASAVEILSSGSFDLMLTDLHMPKLNGYELIPRALELASEMPIIVLSADSTLESIDRVFRHAIKGFLPKPFEDVDQVVQRAHAALNLSQSHRELQSRLARAKSMLERAASDAEEMA